MSSDDLSGIGKKQRSNAYVAVGVDTQSGKIIRGQFCYA
jgi:hypothetical protein